ncbi:VQ motif-containing protein 22-like [Vicia villosa]|uniref:VQ motif-containing protein 22-like n=1 Tax=Vicia villosa TaxID=3911 RepID=UPI00273B68C9|nr:VQ motif-containing protein 22-like [Vicia villosa]
MFQTMSDPPNDFFQFYHQSFPNQPPPNFTTITTNTTPATTLPPPETINPTSPTSATNLGPDGRVSKPIRRRSRASRRTPTTLLNTDTTNFRAMVQQFTGGPIAPFAASASSASTNFSTLAGLGLGPGPRASSHPMNHQTMMSHHPLYQHPQQLQQYQHHYNNNNNNMYSGTGNVGGDESLFFQRLISNPRPSNNDSNINNADIHGGGGEGGFFPNTSS